MSLGDFLIQVKDRKVQKIYGLPSCVGEIKIGDFRETFIMPLDWWTVGDYETQWLEGIERIKHCDESCLVTTIQDLKKIPLIDWWILYKVGSTVYVQNELIAGDCLQTFLNRGEFNRETCYDFIEPRQTVTEDGEKISEWSFEL